MAKDDPYNTKEGMRTDAEPSAHPYDALVPETILDAVETFGFRCTGALLALNSYENRVYRVDVERGEVLKFG